ncbi:MAG: hypothetical protein EOM50_11550 [Erysipelotrichia bacterium]|nr:hypothetical protein [Erysipelotrichia bacterium]
MTVKIKVICGYPGSGKTSYIKEHINFKRDIVYDYDELANTISLMPRHTENKGIHPYLSDILKNMIKRAKNDKKIDCFWIIRTVPDQMFVNLLNGFDVEYFFINKTVFECLVQIQSDPNRKDSDKNWYSLLMGLQSELMKGAFEICQFIN